MPWGRIFATLYLVFWICGTYYAAVAGMTQFELLDPVKPSEVAETAVVDAAENSTTGADVPVIYHGIQFKNQKELGEFLRAKMKDAQDKKEKHLWPWIEVVPRFALLAISASAFGGLGSMARIVKQVLLESRPLEKAPITMTGLFGILMGLMIVGVSYIVPAALTQTTEVQLRPSSLLFLCFFGGVFSTRTYQWIESVISRVFGDEPEDQSSTTETEPE